MDLSPQEIAILKDTYRRIKPQAGDLSDDFYADLFRRDPAIRQLFRDDLAGQGMRFMSAIGIIVNNLDQPEVLEAELDKLAKGHAHFGIRPEWYKTMQEALLDTFRYALGSRFTDEIHLAWRKVFEQVCARIQAA